MSNVIITIVIIGLIIFGLKETVKHFKGEGACCGGGSSKLKKKKLKGKAVCTYTFHIDGMHCQNCAATVVRAVNEIDGAAAKVNYKTGIAKVICDRENLEDSIKTAIRMRGYEVR